MRYDGRWRDRNPAEAPPGAPFVVRLKAPQAGGTVLEDLVQGEIEVANEQLDDMVLLRADGTPTYMLSVVVDDVDMGITHVIRGHDHLTNTFRQIQLYRAMGAALPRFAHIPLIHGPDGAKLSKRHGALSVTEYREMGFLPEAMRNYLLRLGWAHGDEELIATERAAELFDLGGVGRAAARFDMAKLLSVNAHWMRERADADLVGLVAPRLEAMGLPVDEEGRRRLLAGMPGLKQRARTVAELAESAAFYVRPRPLTVADERARKALEEGPAPAALPEVAAALAAVAELEQGDHHHERDQVGGHVDRPVAGVGDDEGQGHGFKADSSHRPREVKPTITTSIQYWDRVASRGSRYTASARSWARTRPATWPQTSAPTCTYHTPVAPITL
jgi:glutamyl-tRNA synthetase